MSEIKTIAQLRQETQATLREAFEIKCLIALWRSRPGLHCEANEKLIREFLKDDVLNPETLAEAVIYLEKQGRLAHITPEGLKTREAEERAELIDTICSQPMSKERETELRAQMNSKYTPLETLRKRAQEVVDAEAFRKMDTKTLRKFIKTNTPGFSQPILPPEYTRKSLIDLSKNDLERFKTLLKIYGDQINIRLKKEEN